jgi:hypothetical protein
MKKKITRIFLAIMVMAFTFGAALNPVMTQVFAAEQTEDQGEEKPPTNTADQTPPADNSQSGTSEHAGHHQM